MAKEKGKEGRENVKPFNPLLLGAVMGVGGFLVRHGLSVGMEVPGWAAAALVASRLLVYAVGGMALASFAETLLYMAGVLLRAAARMSRGGFDAPRGRG